MNRLTSNRLWSEAKDDLENEPGYSYIWTRLNEIENILCADEEEKEYDLDRLSVIMNQRMSMREEVAERFRLTASIPIERLRDLVDGYRLSNKNVYNFTKME